MIILQKLINNAKEFVYKNTENFRIDNIILGKTLYTMKDSDTVFTDMNFCLILLEHGYGFAYFQGEIDYGIKKYVNENISDLLDEDLPIYFKVAIVDAIYCIVNRNSQKDFFLMGNIREKAKMRAGKILEDIPCKTKILLLGAVTEIIEEAIEKDLDIKVLDLENQKIGLRFGNVLVESGDESRLTEMIKQSDYVISTGMIFVSNTADKIFRIVNKNKKRLIMYMETGSNFGPQLIEFGAEKILAEYFPYYDFFGNTKYSIFEKVKS